MSDNVPDLFEDAEFGDAALDGDELLAIFDSLESVTEFPPVTPFNEEVAGSSLSKETPRLLVSQKSTSSSALQQELLSETELETTSPKTKRQKTTTTTDAAAANNSEDAEGQQRMSHITVERNRRKQMNDHLSVLRSLMPCFYVKRGDQASIIGGVVDYINELQQILQSLEAKKQRKVYSEVLSPRLVVSSPRPSPLSPRKPPLSPRLNLPISPRTPQPSSPYKPRGTTASSGYLSPSMACSSLEPSPTSSSSSNINDNINDLFANSKSAIADVEVKFSGPNVLLKTVSPRIPGQAVKIISALEDLSLEILQVNINAVDDQTMMNSFTIKIGIECQLSAEELAQQVQQTFC